MFDNEMINLEEQEDNRTYEEKVKDMCISCKHFDYLNRDKLDRSDCKLTGRPTQSNANKCDKFELKEEEKDNIPLSIKDIIPLNNRDIILTDSGIYLRKYSDKGNKYIDQLILNLNLELLFKTKNIRSNNEELFTYRINNDQIVKNKPIRAILKHLDRYTYKGNTGRDVLKHIFNETSINLEYRNPKYILGFDDKWILPFNEEKENYTIINFTPFEIEAYNKSREMIKEYLPEEKEKIITKLRRFIDKTQMNESKLAIIIGWCLASPFRNVFIKYFDLFPMLILTGFKNTGKTSISDFFTIHFYKIWDKHYSGSSFDSLARAEDLLSTSSFPIQIDEVEFVKDEIIAVIKDSTTQTSDYIRKDGLLNVINKPKITPILICCNYLPKNLLDSALNSKGVNISFSIRERIKFDREWINLRNKLRKEKFFSFIYDFTENWDSQYIINEVNDIEDIIDLELDKEYSRDVKKVFDLNDHPRIKKTYIIILFGLKLFKNIFGIELETKGILELLKISSRNMSKPLLDQFIEFCLLAKDYSSGNPNPSYLSRLLELTRDEKAYKFTSKNLYDFKKFTNNYKLNLKKLAELLRDSIEIKEYIQYKTISIDNKKMMGVMINRSLLDEESKTEIEQVDQQFGIDKIDLNGEN